MGGSCDAWDVTHALSQIDLIWQWSAEASAGLPCHVSSLNRNPMVALLRDAYRTTAALLSGSGFHHTELLGLK